MDELYIRAMNERMLMLFLKYGMISLNTSIEDFVYEIKTQVIGESINESENLYDK